MESFITISYTLILDLEVKISNNYAIFLFLLKGIILMVSSSINIYILIFLKYISSCINISKEGGRIQLPLHLC